MIMVAVKNRFIKLTVCLALCLSFTLPVRGEDTVISLVTGDDYPPFSDSAMPEGGLAIPLIKAALNNQKYTVSVAWKPWKRGYLEAKSGRYAGTFPYRSTPEREEDFLFSDPVFHLQEVIVSRKSEDFQPASYLDLMQKTLCLPIGYAPGKAVQALMDNAKVDVFRPKSMDGCFRAISRFKNLIIKTHKYLAYHQLQEKELNPADFNITLMQDSSYTLHLIVSKQYPDSAQLIADFNKGLANIRKNGKFEKISRRFGMVEP